MKKSFTGDTYLNLLIRVNRILHSFRAAFYNLLLKIANQIRKPVAVVVWRLLWLGSSSSVKIILPVWMLQSHMIFAEVGSVGHERAERTLELHKSII